MAMELQIVPTVLRLLTSDFLPLCLTFLTPNPVSYQFNHNYLLFAFLKTAKKKPQKQ